MQTTKPKGPQLVRPGSIGLGIRVLLGAAILYWFIQLLRGPRSTTLPRST
jgi:hypothetical protein